MTATPEGAVRARSRLLYWLLTEVEWSILHPVMAGVAVCFGALVGVSTATRPAARRARGRPLPARTGQELQPADGRLARTPPPSADGVERDPTVGASHWTRVDVRDMDRGTTWLYVGLLTVVSVAGFVARLPLRRRPPSWWRVLLEIAGSVVVNAAAVWTVRFVGWYQRAYGDDKERWRQDAMAWFGRFGAARGAACKLPEPDGAP